MGTLLVLQADLRSLMCDHWLLPVDIGLSASRSWSRHPVWEAIQPDLPSRIPEGELTVAVPWTGPCRPWPTNVVTGRRGSLDRIRSIALAFLTAATAAGPTSSRAVPLLALPVFSTGHGGKRRVAGDVLRVLVPVLERFAEEHPVDVALVCWTPQDLAAAQQARSSGDRWPELGPALQAEARALADRASRRELVVFFGAGLSAGAGLPMWDALLDELARDAGFTEAERVELARLDALDRGQLLAHRMGADAAELKRAVTQRLAAHTKVAVGHALLAGLPVRELITTNYDTCFEWAADATGRPVAVLPYAPTRTGRWLLKMHGCVTNPDDIVLTREDYVRYGERSAALAGIVQAMLITRHMLFVGFSLKDDNFHRIVDAVRRALRGTARDALGTAVTLEANPLVEALWAEDLGFVSVGDGSSTAEAARRFELFLDCLAAHTTPPVHLLRDRFDGLLTPAQQRLKAVVEPLEAWLRETEDQDGTQALRPVVAAFLRDLGAD